MSMYTTLLGAALEQRDHSHRGATVEELVAACTSMRDQLGASGFPSPPQASTLRDVTSRLAYDVSLIRLVRGFGLDFVLEDFDNGERHRLEQVLIDRGLPHVGRS